MSQYSVLVADSTQAKLFTLDRGAEKLEELDQLRHDEARQRERDINSDRPGRQQGGGGAGSSHHGVNVEDSAREQENTVFAKHIGEYLEADRVRQNPRGLIIMAPPHFLGILRKQLSGECQKLVVQTVNKDLAQSTAQAILDHIELPPT